MLRFAVVGVGRMGKRHAFNLAHGLVRGASLAAVCDIDEDALKWCGKFCKKAKQYTSVEQMLASERLDAVVVAVPHYAHEEVAVRCIEAGINTLVEKPLAVTALAAENIIAASKAHPDVKVGVSFNQRSNRMYIKAKKLLDSGMMGDISRINFIITDWYRSQAYYNQGGWRASYSGEGGGCLINQCVHQLDILQWLAGMPKSIVAQCDCVDRDITVENDVAAIFDFGGYKCSFSASTHEIKGTNRLEIACDKGKIVILKRRMTAYLHKSEKTVNAETKTGYGFATSRKKVYTYGFFRLIIDLLKGQQARALSQFGKAVAGKGEMLATAAEGLNTVQIINAVYYSAWQGKEVSVPVDAREYDAELKERAKKETEIKSNR